MPAVASGRRRYAGAIGNEIRTTAESRRSRRERKTERCLVLPRTFGLGWLGNENHLYVHMRSGLRMKNNDVRCSSQTAQHVVLRHLFRDIRLDARIRQIELVIIRKHLKFVHVLHAAQRSA